MKPNNVIRIPCKEKNIFRYWLEFLTPFHHLTSREIDVATVFLYKRYCLSKVILDLGLLEKTIMNEDTQREIRDECGLTAQHFQVIRTKLKDKQFFINDKINPRLIPNIKEDGGLFQLLLIFDYTNDVSTDN